MFLLLRKLCLHSYIIPLVGMLKNVICVPLTFYSFVYVTCSFCVGVVADIYISSCKTLHASSNCGLICEPIFTERIGMPFCNSIGCHVVVDKLRACVVAAHGSPPKGRHCGVVLRVLGHPYLPAPWAHDHERACLLLPPAATGMCLPSKARSERHQRRHTSPSLKQNKMDILQRREYLSVQFRNHTHTHTTRQTWPCWASPAFGSTAFKFFI
jgi:hypothetical protein